MVPSPVPGLTRGPRPLPPACPAGLARPSAGPRLPVPGRAGARTGLHSRPAQASVSKSAIFSLATEAKISDILPSFHLPFFLLMLLPNLEPTI